jgi:hypothetical protein
MVERRESAPEGVAIKGLRRITAQEEKLRREKIALLREELAKHREAARVIEQQLRALGDPEAMRSVGWVHWDGVFDQLPARFSARDVAALAGVGPAHVASIVHRWKRHGRIVGAGRGEYRKVTVARKER